MNEIKKEITLDDILLEMRQGFGTVNEKFAKVDERFNRVDERFAQIDERFNRVDERFDKLDENIGNLDKLITRVAVEVGEILKRLDTMDARQVAISHKFNHKLENHEQRLHVLEVREEPKKKYSTK